jgi:hypothetical protein
MSERIEEGRGYYVREGGVLEIVRVLRDGAEMLDSAGYPLTRTDEVRELVGWPDERARVYHNEVGREILVPETGRYQVREWLEEPNEDGEVFGRIALRTDSIRAAEDTRSVLCAEHGEDAFAIVDTETGDGW